MTTVAVMGPGARRVAVAALTIVVTSSTARAAGPPSDAPAGPPSDTADAPATLDPSGPEGAPATDPAPADEPSPAVDAGREEAREAFFQGTKAYSLGRFDEAIVNFERAYELSEEPMLLFNLGQAYWKRYDVSQDIEHLRRAKAMFLSYENSMRELGAEDARELQAILRAVQAQLDAAEQALENEKLAALGRGATSQELREQRRRRTTRGLEASGVAMIVLGSLGAGLGLAGGATRGISGWMLDQAGGAEGGQANTNTLDQDRRQRNAYEVGGQLAFSGIIVGAVLLPVGIGLKVAATMRDRKDIQRREQKEREVQERMRLSATHNGLVIQF